MKEESKNSGRDRGCVHTGKGHTTYVWELQENIWRPQVPAAKQVHLKQGLRRHPSAMQHPSRHAWAGVEMFKKKDGSHVVHLNFVKKNNFGNNFGSKAWSMWSSGSVKPDHAEISTQNTSAEQCEIGKVINTVQ